VPVRADDLAEEDPRVVDPDDVGAEGSHRTGRILRRRVMGCWVPHFRSVKRRMLTKYTSALNGLWNPCFQPRRVERTGRLSVASVYRPGSKTSRSDRNDEDRHLASRTVSQASILISLSRKR
jgi:hypothetical protein